MRSGRSLVLLLLTMTALSALLGCGDDGRDPIVATPVLGTVQLSLVANGPAGLVFPATSTYQVRLSNAADNTAMKTNGVTAAGNTLTMAAATLADVAPGQFYIEVLCASTATTTTSAPMFRAYFVQTYANGEVTPVNRTIDLTDTARAWAYASWAKAKTKTINDFSPNAASLSALVATMTARLQAFSGGVGLSFKWNPGISSLATSLGKVTP